MRKVFDSSAVLAFLLAEPGAERLRSEIPDGAISAVNAAEVLAVLARKGMPVADAHLALVKTGLTVVGFGMGEALKTAQMLTPAFREKGISLGDRACMALALVEGLPAVTAERCWAALGVPELDIELIRD